MIELGYLEALKVEIQEMTAILVIQGLHSFLSKRLKMIAALCFSFSWMLYCHCQLLSFFSSSVEASTLADLKLHPHKSSYPV